jgi:hypothetical protein
MHSIFDAWDKNLELDKYHAQVIRAFWLNIRGTAPRSVCVRL